MTRPASRSPAMNAAHEKRAAQAANPKTMPVQNSLGSHSGSPARQPRKSTPGKGIANAASAFIQLSISQGRGHGLIDRGLVYDRAVALRAAILKNTTYEADSAACCLPPAGAAGLNILALLRRYRAPHLGAGARHRGDCNPWYARDVCRSVSAYGHGLIESPLCQECSVSPAPVRF